MSRGIDGRTAVKFEAKSTNTFRNFCDPLCHQQTMKQYTLLLEGSKNLTCHVNPLYAVLFYFCLFLLMLGSEINNSSAILLGSAFIPGLEKVIYPRCFDILIPRENFNRHFKQGWL